MMVDSNSQGLKLTYRADIDGLRAIAILVVLLFHLGVSSFRGGYIGVDVFFVISGFLITRLIRDEVLATGTFSFYNFYIRRVRRLFPALAFTLFLTLLAAMLLFSVQFFERFGASLLHALFSLSNFYFLKNNDYFAPTADLEPLLHTWSLSVEEQFYLLWPITLVFLLKKSWAFRLSFLLIGFAASLTLTQHYIHQPSMVFYLLPFRVFEFVIGALMVWIVQSRSAHGWLAEFLAALGLLLILYAATTYTSNQPFPSFNALTPCLGAALIIYAGQARYMGKLFANRACVSLGLISYSLYLIHWPLIAFYKYYMDIETLGRAEALSIGVLSVIAAWIMYKYIERPFRKPSNVHVPSSKFLATNLAIILVMTSASLYARVSDGAKWRAGGLAEYAYTNYAGSNYGWSQTLGKSGSPALIIYGDSHSKQYLPAFEKLAEQNGLYIEYLGHPACLSLPGVTNIYKGASHQSCIDMLAKLKAMAKGNNAPIVLAYRYTKTIVDLETGYHVSYKNEDAYERVLLQGLDRLQMELGKNHTIILMGGVPGAHSKHGYMDCITRPLVRYACNEQYPLQQAEFVGLREKFRKYVATRPGFVFLDPYDALCDSRYCYVVQAGQLYYSDHAHLTISGADSVISHFAPAIMQVVHSTSSPGGEFSSGF